MICENCGNEHEGTFGSGRFCCKKCARGFSTKAKRSLINIAISKKRKLSAHKDVTNICKNVEKPLSFIGIKDAKIIVLVLVQEKV